MNVSKVLKLSCLKSDIMLKFFLKIPSLLSEARDLSLCGVAGASTNPAWFAAPPSAQPLGACTIAI